MFKQFVNVFMIINGVAYNSYEEVNCKTASDHFTCFSFSFSIKSMIRLDFIICWFLLYIIAEKSIKIFFYEIKLGNKVETHYH